MINFTATKYLDYLPEIIESPDYAGYNSGSLELVKVFKDNIFVSIKLDMKKNTYFVATMFDVKDKKIESYIKSGRLKKVPKTK